MGGEHGKRLNESGFGDKGSRSERGQENFAVGSTDDK